MSFRKLDLTSQTSNMCNILSPLYHAYFQPIDLAMFKVVKLCLIWDFLFLLLDTRTWPDGSYEGGSIRAPVCP